MILSCNNINKSYGDEVILKDISFHIEDNEKAAIVGINGAGKSTLLKIIIGELSADDGEVTFAKNSSFGYLAQHMDMSGSKSIYEEILSSRQDILDMEDRLRAMEARMNDVSGADLDELMESYNRLHHEFDLEEGYAYRSSVTGVLKGLGFDEADFTKKTDELSGGQKTRVALGKLLVTKPDLLLLDEPTNHLDIDSISWLETFLLNYKGAVIIVAHDRYFLDKVVSKVVEIEKHKALVFPGNYTEFAAKKAVYRESQIRAYLNQQREIKHQEEVIDKLKQFNREKSIKRAESREKALDKVERLEKPTEENTRMHLTLSPRIESGKDVLSVEGLSKSFGDNCLFENLSFEIKKGERVAFIGANGTGKTTLLKIICGLIPGDAGEFKVGANVYIGYYDQEHKGLDDTKTLYDEIGDSYKNLTETEIRNTLAAFLFTEEDVYKKIGDLSGGEKGRVALAKLMLSGTNFLILDEPTNHLDITSKEILEDVLINYTGTVLFVSHDRYFINRTATRILNIDHHKVTNYLGNYDYYLNKKAELIASGVVESSIGQGGMDNVAARDKVIKTGGLLGDSEAKTDWKSQKENQAKKRKLENELKKTEERIETLESKSAELEKKLENPDIATSSVKLQEVTNELTKVKDELSSCYDSWEELTISLEDFATL